MNKQALGWKISYLKGINPTICTHHIYLEEESKVVRQPHRRLNPHLHEVVRIEVLKLLQAGIIYPIYDSTWVSPTQVVPKKSGVTTVKNEKCEELSTRLTTGWRVCIDYRRLNEVTRKDHFPLPFIDQLLERVSGHPFYLLFGWVFRVLSDRDCTRRSRKDHLYLSIWHLCLQEDAFWPLQRPCHLSKMYA